jgi:hypothetical protein
MTLRNLTPLLLTFTLLGCATRTGTVQLKSIDSNARFSQKFSHGYTSRAEDGTYNVVLVHDPAEGERGKPGAPLKPASAVPMRQIMHVRVLWKPLKSGRADDATAAANATIDWYVLSEDARQRMNMLHYRGGGLVSVTGSAAAPRIQIRNATVKPVSSSGNLEDPIGNAQLSGNMLTRRDPRRVQLVLDELKSTAQSAAAR